MSNIQHKLNRVREEMLFIHRNKIIDLYKKSYSLGEICRELCLDVSSILCVLRKSKLKKRTLYKIYQEQTSKKHEQRNELFLESDKFYIDKFFPQSDSNYFPYSYYWFWKEKYKKEQEMKMTCTHKIRTIKCSLCNKILKDASNIPLDDVIVTKLNAQN